MSKLFKRLVPFSILVLGFAAYGTYTTNTHQTDREYCSQLFSAVSGVTTVNGKCYIKLRDGVWMQTSRDINPVYSESTINQMRDDFLRGVREN